MSQSLTEIDFDLEEAERNLITEDDEPADNMFSAKQQRLLVEPLYASWTPPSGEGVEGRAREIFWPTQMSESSSRSASNRSCRICF